MYRYIVKTRIRLKYVPRLTCMVVFYMINFNDNDRKTRMIGRFRSLGLDLQFVTPVFENDSRIENTTLYKRTSSIMLQHLDSIRHFYENTSADYCVVCEDDIYISKSLATDLPNIIDTFSKLQLDVLLMGYLFPYSLHGNWHFPVLRDTTKYCYHGYPDDMWGSQMYMVSRKHAKYLLDTFTIQFAVENLEKIHYNPDWTITKYGKRAAISPMMAVEEGDEKSGHEGQSDFHKMCFINNYRPDQYV